MKKNLVRKNAKFVMLLSIVSAMGIQTSEASTKVYCPAPNTLKVTGYGPGGWGHKGWFFEGSTTGDVELLMRNGFVPSDDRSNKPNLSDYSLSDMRSLHGGDILECVYKKGGEKASLIGTETKLKNCNVKKSQEKSGNYFECD